MLSTVGVYHIGTLKRRGEESVDGFEDSPAPLVFQRGADEHGENSTGHYALAQAFRKLVLREAAFVEIFFKQIFIALGDIFHSHIVQELNLFRKGGRNLAFLEGASILKAEPLAAEDIDVPDKFSAFHNGIFKGDGFDVQSRNAFKRHLEISAVAIKLIDDDDSGKIVIPNLRPEMLRQRTHAVYSVDDEQRTVNTPEQILEIPRKVAVAGNVHKKLTALVPGKGGRAGLNRTAALDFFRLVVEAGGTFLNGTHTVDGAGVEKQHFSNGSFAAAASAHNGISALHIKRGWHNHTPGLTIF